MYIVKASAQRLTVKWVLDSITGAIHHAGLRPANCLPICDVTIRPSLATCGGTFGSYLKINFTNQNAVLNCFSSLSCKLNQQPLNFYAYISICEEMYRDVTPHARNTFKVYRRKFSSLFTIDQIFIICCPGLSTMRLDFQHILENRSSNLFQIQYFASHCSIHLS